MIGLAKWELHYYLQKHKICEMLPCWLKMVPGTADSDALCHVGHHTEVRVVDKWGVQETGKLLG